MEIVFRMLADGGFVAGDRDSEMTSYAYPSSPHAIVAKRHPKLVAEEMLASERRDYRKIPAILDYDCKNWLLLANAEKQLSPSEPEEFKHESDCPCFGDTVEHSIDCKNCTCETNPRYRHSLRAGAWHHGLMK